MNPKFQHQVLHQTADVTFLKLSGVVDEDNELGAAAERLTTPKVVIDLSEIERINSCGVRDWVNWLGKVEKGGVEKTVFIHCSPSIVAQINLVSNFTGNGVVQSFYAPYFCPNCEREKVDLVETRDVAGRTPFKAPVCRCDECDGVMDFDDMEDSYFAFLSNTKKIVTDDTVDSMLSEVAPPAAGADKKLRLRSSTSNPGASISSPSGGGGSGAGSTATPSGVGGASPSSGQSSMPSVPSLRQGGTGSFQGASVTVTKTNPSGIMTSGSGQKWPPPLGDEASRRFLLAPPPEEPRSAGAWILVGCLVVAALALLAYVFFSGGSKPTHAGQSAGEVPAVSEQP